MDNRMKSYHLHLHVEDYKKGERHVSDYETYLTIDENTVLRDFIDFEDEAKQIWRTAISAAKRAALVEVELTRALYERTGDPDERLKSMDFDRWHTRELSDITTEKGEEGVYLAPDTRYTEETHDMWLGRDIMRDVTA